MLAAANWIKFFAVRQKKRLGLNKTKKEKFDRKTNYWRFYNRLLCPTLSEKETP